MLLEPRTPNESSLYNLISSARRPVPRSDAIPVPVDVRVSKPLNLQYSLISNPEDMNVYNNKKQSQRDSEGVMLKINRLWVFSGRFKRFGKRSVPS